MGSEKPAVKSGAQRRLESVVETVFAVARAKGWSPSLQSSDDSKFRYSSISVWKNFSGQEVTATFDFTIDKGVKMSGSKTSFHSHGVQDLRDAIWNEIGRLSWLEGAKDPDRDSIKVKPDSEILLVLRMLRRFHASVRQLKHRYNDRRGILIVDEYDVQDYIHALLRALFDDIRCEEYTPSYAGGASRIDFLLKKESIAIEVKVASPTLRDRKIGEQLLIDIQRYQSHPDCRTLFCFVYDPNGEVRNPAGLEADLTKKHGELDVRAIVISPA